MNYIWRDKSAAVVPYCVGSWPFLHQEFKGVMEFILFLLTEQVNGFVVNFSLSVFQCTNHLMAVTHGQFSATNNCLYLSVCWIEAM